MQTGVPRQFFQVLTAGVLSILLLLPTAVKFAHDILEHHAHELCADELKGEVHYHPVETECHFHPVYLSPYSVSQPVQLPVFDLGEPLYTRPVPEAVCLDEHAVVSLRGPPAA